MRAIQRNLLVVSGWRKYVEDEVPDTEPERESCQEEESQAEPDSTSEPSTPAPHRSVSITHDVSYPEEGAAENASPDSTTIEEKPEERSFLERPKKKVVEEDDDDAFDQLVKLNTSKSPQRKVALGTSKIQINVGSDFKKEVTDKEKPAEDEKPASTGNPEPQQQVAPAEKMEDEQEEKPVMKVTESGDAPLPNEASSDLKTENKADEKEEAMSSDEKERKRKRPEADESEKSEEKDSDELEQPATPQKVQKTE